MEKERGRNSFLSCQHSWPTYSLCGFPSPPPSSLFLILHYCLCLPLISCFYSLVHWISLNYEYFPMNSFFWEFSSFRPAWPLKAAETTCSSTAPLIPSRMLLWLIVDQSTFSHVLNLFLSATITEKGLSLSFVVVYSTYVFIGQGGTIQAGPAQSKSAKCPALHSPLCSLCGLGFCPSLFLPILPLDPLVFSNDDVAMLCPEITHVTQRAAYSFLSLSSCYTQTEQQRIFQPLP